MSTKYTQIAVNLLDEAILVTDDLTFERKIALCDKCEAYFIELAGNTDQFDDEELNQILKIGFVIHGGATSLIDSSTSAKNILTDCLDSILELISTFKTPPVSNIESALWLDSLQSAIATVGKVDANILSIARTLYFQSTVKKEKLLELAENFEIKRLFFHIKSVIPVFLTIVEVNLENLDAKAKFLKESLNIH